MGLLIERNNQHRYSYYFHDIHRVWEKSATFFDYKSRISWSIFYNFLPMETGINLPQSHVIYSLKGLMTS